MGVDELVLNEVVRRVLAATKDTLGRQQHKVANFVSDKGIQQRLSHSHFLMVKGILALVEQADGPF